MVEIPALALDRQNWKIFHTKLIEATATQHVLGLLAGWEVELDDNNSEEWDDWYGYDAIAKFLIYPTLPLELLRPIWKLRTAHKMFEFLAHQFHDYDLIKWDAHTKKAKTCTNKNVNNGIAGAANVHTEDAYQAFKQAGIAAESPKNPQRSGDRQVINNGNENAMHRAENMSKGLKKFAGACYRCRKAGHRAHDCRTPRDTPKCSAQGQMTMDGRKQTRRRKKCNNSTTNVDGTALLGGALVKRTCPVDKVDKTMHSDPQRLVQAQTNYEENQHSGNTKINVPGAHGLLLKGEWIVCVSSKASCEMGMNEHTSVDNEVEVFAKTPTECCQQLVSTDGDAGQKAKPVDTLNETEALVTMLINLENPGGGDMPHMYLASTNWCAGDLNGLGSQTDGLNCKVDVSTGQVDILRGWMDTLEVSSSAETASVSQGDDAETYPGIGDTKHAVFKMDGIGSHVDTSTGHGKALSIESNTIKPINVMETIRSPQKKQNPPDSPISAPKQLPGESDGLGNQTDALSIRMDAYTIGNKTETTANEAETISMCLIGSKLPNPPTRGANSCGNESDRHRDHADMLNVCMNVHSIGIDSRTPINVTETVRIPQNESKLPNLPIRTAKWAADEPDACGNRMDASRGRMDVPSIENEPKPPTNT